MADSTVNDLTAASTLDGTELLYGVQGGADRKVTVAQVRAGLLPLTGGALSGDLVLAGAPTQALHPASKTYVDTGLSGKAASVHTHVTGDVSGLDTALSGKAATSHTHTAANVTDFSEAVDDRVAALLVAGTGITLTYDDPAGTITVDAAGGGGTIDGSGTADYVARWTDANTLAAAALRDNGTRAAVGDAPSSTASFTVKAQTGDNYCLAIYGTGGVIVPTVLLKHSSDVNGVAIKGDDTGFQFANGGEGTTLYVVPGYPEAYVKTHGSSAGRLNFQSHDGGSYVTVFALKNGKAQLWDGTNLLDVGFGANDSETAGYRNVRVANA